MPNFTHVISSIETEAMNSLGSGFSALNIGDEIIEINNQVVVKTTISFICLVLEEKQHFCSDRLGSGAFS